MADYESVYGGTGQYLQSSCALTGLFNQPSLSQIQKQARDGRGREAVGDDGAVGRDGRVRGHERVGMREGVVRVDVGRGERAALTRPDGRAADGDLGLARLRVVRVDDREDELLVVHGR